MKWSWFGRALLALISAGSLGLSMTACGGGTIAYLWGVGSTASGSGQIVAYKVDDYTGNLTASPEQPYSSHDSNPVQILVRPGGRFVYVINQGSGFGPGTAGTSEGIDEYAVGGEGTLTFENHYDTNGFGHLWGAFDSTGNTLFVLDKYSPTYQGDSTQMNYDPNGAVFAFTSDSTTGRLQLTAQNNFTQPNQPAPLYVEVGANPLRMFSTGGCLLTLNSTGQTVTSYTIASGQLGTVTTGTYPVGSVSATSISGNSTDIFITDSRNSTSAGQIFSYTLNGCNLVPFTQSPVTTESAGAINPANTLITTTGKYVYVLNVNNSSTQINAQGSTVSGYVINASAGQLQELSGSPFPIGPGPVCMVEDPTSKYLYAADQTDGSLTGFRYSDTTGELDSLSRGSRFQSSVLHLNCLTISAIV